MDRHRVLGIMKDYFRERQPPEALKNFAEQSPRALLPESIDAIDFVIYLEERLGREIDITRLGPALVSMGFGDLAGEVSRFLAED